MYTCTDKYIFSVGGLIQPGNKGFSDACEVFDVEKGKISGINVGIFCLFYYFIFLKPRFKSSYYTSATPGKKWIEGLIKKNFDIVDWVIFMPAKCCDFVVFLFAPFSICAVWQPALPDIMLENIHDCFEFMFKYGKWKHCK